jgi:hypothetical protein
MGISSGRLGEISFRGRIFCRKAVRQSSGPEGNVARISFGGVYSAASRSTKPGPEQSRRERRGYKSCCPRRFREFWDSENGERVGFIRRRLAGAGLCRDRSGVAGPRCGEPKASQQGVEKWAKSIDITPTIAHRTVRYLVLFTSGSPRSRNKGQ